MLGPAERVAPAGKINPGRVKYVPLAVGYSTHADVEAAGEKKFALLLQLPEECGADVTDPDDHDTEALSFLEEGFVDDIQGTGSLTGIDDK
jgi:hypothetical protein